MDKLLKITGLYDRKTLKMLSGLGVQHFGFDFRPKSFNFLQQYLFMELMDSSYSPLNNYYLQFQNEAVIVIQKIVDDFFAQDEVTKADGNILLEFNDVQTPEYYDQFELPFAWHFYDFDSFIEVIKSKNLKEIVLDYTLLAHLNDNGSLLEFVEAFNKITQGKDFDLVLGLDWDADIFPSLEEFFDFSIHSFGINQKTEVSYRNVDVIAVKKHLQQYIQV